MTCRLAHAAISMVLLAGGAAAIASDEHASVSDEAHGQAIVRRLAVAWNDADTGNGMVQAMQTSDPWQFQTPALAVGGDAVMRFALGRLFVLSTRDGTLSVIDPARWTVMREYQLGASSHPLDIAPVSVRRAYLTRRDASHLLRLNLITGAMDEVLDLGHFAGGEPLPELGMMGRVGTRLFIQVRRFNVPPAILAVADLATEQLIDVDPATPQPDGIVLAGRAPRFKMQRLGSAFLVSATGGFFDDGGLELVDASGLRSLGLVVREVDGQVGADLGAFTMVSANRGFLTYSTDLLTSSHLHAFAPDGNVDPNELHTTLSYFVPRLLFDAATNAVFYPEGGWASPGVLAFDASTGERLTREPTAISGTPTDLELIAFPDAGR